MDHAGEKIQIVDRVVAVPQFQRDMEVKGNLQSVLRR